MNAFYYLEAGEGLERHIHQNDIGMIFHLEPVERFVTVTRLGNHFHIRLEIDEHRHAMPQHGMVVHQHYLCFQKLTYQDHPHFQSHFHAAFGAARNSSVAPSCLARYFMILMPIPGVGQILCQHRQSPVRCRISTGGAFLAPRPAKFSHVARPRGVWRY